ncbi:uncharacterized protein LOC106063613 isoform X2 [Biomphalaria glabrata]|uniref:Uncharacterized protein LOC106063613 isoform X2 n=1 Tax=Biomphalaria glabrata TaxID=6526 RepID=A0A9W3BMQ7_BIOGL|nr:uncharacterized protein LOC106063613 isoform X2 [Biomphalaria glabrata]
MLLFPLLGLCVFSLADPGIAQNWTEGEDVFNETSTAQVITFHVIHEALSGIKDTSTTTTKQAVQETERVKSNEGCLEAISKCSNQNSAGQDEPTACSVLTKTLDCLEVARDKCASAEEVRLLSASISVALAKQEEQCNSCGSYVEEFNCGAMMNDLNKEIEVDLKCSKAVEAMECYGKATNQCIADGKGKSAQLSANPAKDTYDHICRECFHERKKCDKMMLRGSLTKSDKRLCRLYSKAIACYDEAEKKCHKSDQVRKLDQARLVAKTEYNSKCNPCLQASKVCQGLYQASVAKVNSSSSCSKLPQAISCFDRVIKTLCAKDKEKSSLEVSKSVSVSQFELLCLSQTDTRKTKVELSTLTTRSSGYKCINDGMLCHNQSKPLISEANITKTLCMRLNETRQCFTAAMTKCLTAEEVNVLDSLLLRVDQKFFLNCRQLDGQDNLGLGSLVSADLSALSDTGIEKNIGSFDSCSTVRAEITLLVLPVLLVWIN